MKQKLKQLKQQDMKLKLLSNDKSTTANVPCLENEKTRSQDSEDVWSLRFPRFLRFRGFVAGEKI